MNPNFGFMATAIAVLQLQATLAHAQVPASIAGTGLLVDVTYGTYPLASDGYFLFLPANSGNAYSLIGISQVAGDTGTYTYTAGGTSAQLRLSSPANGNGIATVGFVTPTSGTFAYSSSSYPGLRQGGNFVGATGAAPAAIASRAIACAIEDGRSPFANVGSFTLTTSSPGGTYQIAESGGIAQSSGTYSYSTVNRSTAALRVNDSRTGSSTVYLCFSDVSSGHYALKQASSGAFQVGTFVVTDTAGPTVSISNPASARTYTNAQTVTVTATASDNVMVTKVEFYEGTAWKATDEAAPYTCDWPITAADNGAHVWTAVGYDAVGNISTSSPVTFTVSIDLTPPIVAITSPTNGAIVTTSPRTVSGTANDSGSPASGIAVVQVRVNGGGWANATGTTSWSRSVSLGPCANLIEARSRDYGGNYSSLASIAIIYSSNTPPNVPMNTFPPAGSSGISVTPLLQASAFSDRDCAGDTHAASQWQVWNSAGTVAVASSGTDMVNRVSWAVPAGKLYYGSNYQWRVRYRDSRNAWSGYSAMTRFTNGGPLLNAVREGSSLVLTWPTNAPGFALQWSADSATGTWSKATPSPVVVSGNYTFTCAMTNTVRFYRLKK